MSEDLAQTVSALEARLKRLEATEAIRKLIHLYAFYCDNGYDDDSWSQLFTPDGVFDVGELGFCRGTEELRAYMRSLPNEIHWAHHYMSNEIIDVADDGESGTANWLIWEVATMASDDPDLDDAVVLMGAYRGNAIQTDGTWKFSEVSASFKHMSNLDQGWVRQPFRATEIGTAQQ